jgi:hypothetical protein
MSFFQTPKFFWCRVFVNDINSLDSVCAQTLFWIQPGKDPRADGCGLMKNDKENHQQKRASLREKAKAGGKRLRETWVDATLVEKKQGWRVGQ